MNKLRMVILAILLCLAGAYAAAGQTGEPQKVCISQDAANKCSELADKTRALEEAVSVRDEAITQLKIELAQAVQKNADQEAALVRLTSLFELVLKNCTKPKKFGLINF